MRNETTTERRRENRNKHRGANRKIYRKIKKETPRGDWQRLATEARRITTQPQNRPIKAITENNINRPRTKLTKLEQVSSEA